jgi:hypothetical protein
MSKPVLRTKKEIKLPANTGSIVISYRAVKRKGGTRNTRKVNVPRGAEQVAVRIKKTRTATPKKDHSVKKRAPKKAKPPV